MNTADDIANLDAQVRWLEQESRRLRQQLADHYFAAALTGLLSRGWQPFDMAVTEAWKIAALAIDQRPKTS